MQLGEIPVFFNFFFGGGRNFKKKKKSVDQGPARWLNGLRQLPPSLVAWVLSLGPHDGRKEPTPITYALMATLGVWHAHAYTHTQKKEMF